MKINDSITDENLVENIQSGKNIEKCLKILIERHSGLCVSIIEKYLSPKSNLSLNQELVKDKDFQIYEAALKYKFNKNAKFSTYLGNEVTWKCLNIYNKSKKNRVISVENNYIDYLNVKCNKENDINELDVFSSIIDRAKNHPDKRVGRIFYLRYVVGKNNSVMPWKNISEDIGMSIQGCINIHNSMINKLKPKNK